LLQFQPAWIYHDNNERWYALGDRGNWYGQLGIETDIAAVFSPELVKF
jgi:hypothetical protein